MVEFDFYWIQKIRADIAAVDFASYKGRNEFADILRRRYTVRELFLFKEMAPEDWGAQTRADDLTCKKLWDCALEEAQSLIVQIRAHGGGAITQPIVEKDATGEKMPNPEMLFDLPDGLWDLPIVTLRANAVRAMKKTVVMQDVAEIARRGADAAEGVEAGVSFLVHDRKGKQAANRERGKESREKAVLDDAERQRAERDVQTALKRVADDPDVKAGKHGAILTACRRVCSRFATLTDAKKNVPTYLPLTQANGTPIKAKTLARYYREKHKTKRGKK